MFDSAVSQKTDSVKNLDDKHISADFWQVSPCNKSTVTIQIIVRRLIQFIKVSFDLAS